MSKFEGITYKFFNYSAPYCGESKIQHPTSRVVGIGTLKYATASIYNWLALLKHLILICSGSLMWPIV